MPDLLPVEQARAAGIAEECDCCPYPCCDYCRVQIGWTVTANAERETGSGPSKVVETVDWNVSLLMVFNRLDDIGAPSFPLTFRIDDTASDEDECQLLSNGGPFVHTTDGSYSYVKTLGGTEIDSEDADLTPQINTFQFSLNCECLQIDTDTSSVGFTLDPGVSGVSTMPSGWVKYFRNKLSIFTNIGDFTPCVGTVITTEHNELGGWDSSTIVDTASVSITRCEDI